MASASSKSLPKKRLADILNGNKNAGETSSQTDFKLQLDDDDVDIKPYKCKLCILIFLERSDLEKHEIEHIKNEDGYECYACHDLLPTLGELEEHIQETHRGQAKKSHLCHICFATFPKKNDLRKHMAYHPNIEWLIEEEKTEPNDVDVVNNDLNQHENKKKTYKCYSCPEIFDTLNDLIEHAKIHTKPKPYECDICPRKFSRASTLKAHKKTAHNPLTFKIYNCQTCRMIFFTCNDLKEHAKAHIKGTGKRYECHLCLRTFSRACTLKKHEETAHDISKDANGFNCLRCFKIFRTCGGLKQHRTKMHTTKKSF